MCHCQKNFSQGIAGKGSLAGIADSKSRSIFWKNAVGKSKNLGKRVRMRGGGALFKGRQTHRITRGPTVGRTSSLIPGGGAARGENSKKKISKALEKSLGHCTDHRERGGGGVSWFFNRIRQIKKKGEHRSHQSKKAQRQLGISGIWLKERGYLLYGGERVGKYRIGKVHKRDLLPGHNRTRKLRSHERSPSKKRAKKYSAQGELERGRNCDRYNKKPREKIHWGKKESRGKGKFRRIFECVKSGREVDEWWGGGRTARWG